MVYLMLTSIAEDKRRTSGDTNSHSIHQSNFNFLSWILRLDLLWISTLPDDCLQAAKCLLFTGFMITWWQARKPDTHNEPNLMGLLQTLKLLMAVLESNVTTTITRCTPAWTLGLT